MALTPSNTLSLHTPASDFALIDAVSGQRLKLSELKSDVATVIMFICNHCPFVKHIQKELVQLANDYIAKGVSFIAISSNDVATYPDDAPDKMKLEAEQHHYPFSYLYDETQEVAKAYQAACTPDFYIYDKDLKLAYHGQMDDSRPSSHIPVSGADMRKALDALLQGQAPNPQQKPSVGCNIKWK